jgi:exopolysaccharide biosynthesis polyprenyl glycosylphosphotransferase
MYRFRQLVLLAGDLAMLTLGLFLAVSLRYWQLSAGEFALLLPTFATLFAMAAVIAFIIGLYDLTRAKNSWGFFQKIILASVVWTAAGISFFYLRPPIYVSPGHSITPKTILLLTALVGFGGIALWRFFHNRFLSHVLWQQTVVFVGCTKETLELISLFKREPGLGFAVVGIVHHTPVEGILTSGTLEELKARLGQRTINVIAIHASAASGRVLTELYEQIFRQIEIIDLAIFYERVTGRIPPFTFSESWFLSNLKEQDKKIYDRFRIFFDYAIAVIMGVVSAVAFPFIAFSIYLNSPGPVLFKQTRIGRGGRPFIMYKFRTMVSLTKEGSAETEGPQFASVGDARVTRVGRFLRRARLDELLQFINILKGEMAIIGPRPERPEFVEKLTAAMPFYSLRHLLKPGLSGWAQVQRSYYGDIEENLFKLQYDLFYLKNRGPILDLAILLKTINTLLRFAGR